MGKGHPGSHLGIQDDECVWILKKVHTGSPWRNPRQWVCVGTYWFPLMSILVCVHATMSTSWWDPSNSGVVFFLVHLYGYSWKLYPSNSGVVFLGAPLWLPQQLWGSGKNISHWVSLPLTRALSHTHTLTHSGSLSHSLYSLSHSLTHNHSTSLSFTLMHTNKNDRGKLPFFADIQVTTNEWKHDEWVWILKKVQARRVCVNGKTTSFCRDPGSY